MKLEKRKALLLRLGYYMLGDDDGWVRAKEKAFEENRWFIPEFIELSVKTIVENLDLKMVIAFWANIFVLFQFRSGLYKVATWAFVPKSFWRFFFV